MKRTLRIVVVDDDEDDREFFKIALEKCRVNYTVNECVNGEDLMKYLSKNENVDYIFLDINMPKVNGLEVLNLLAPDSKYQNTRVIMLSTASSPLTVDQCYKSGATAYIIKPNTTGLLESMISFCLNKLTEKPERNKFILNEYAKFRKLEAR